jgi:hypothetical protein
MPGQKYWFSAIYLLAVFLFADMGKGKLIGEQNKLISVPSGNVVFGCHSEESRYQGDERNI